MLACASSGAAVRDALWVTDGPVYAVAVFGTHTGGATGGGVVIDTATVLLDRAYPRIEGTVHAVVADGRGGWFVGGQFATVDGQPRANLLHIRPDRSVDVLWDPAPDGAVRALALSPDGATLYVGGDFTLIAGTARTRIAALDAVTGAARDWVAGADATVRVLALSPDGATLYVGGDFTATGGQARARLAALETANGTVLAGWQADADAAVHALRLADDILYVGGAFTTVNGASRGRLGAVKAADGAVLDWNAEADATVRTLAYDAGSGLLYAGGDFTVIGGAARNYIAVLDTAAIEPDRATNWNPGADAPVHALLLVEGTLYAGGDFTRIGGAARDRIAALETDTAGATDWDPGLDGTVEVLAGNGGRLFVGGAFNGATDRATLYIGGDFGYVGPATGSGVGLPADPLQPRDDRPLAGYPAINGPVYAVVADGSGGWYVGGDFSRVGGLARRHLVHILADRSVDPAWDPAPDAPVRALARDGATLYVGGDFTVIGGQARSRIAALDGAGAATAWDPGADGTVRTLLAVGGTVYAGGDFTVIGGQARSRIAALDGAGAATAWDPGADGTVRAMSLGSDGTTLYVGGDFGSFDGGNISRAYLAALDTTTTVRADIPTAWDPAPDAPVYALALAGTTLYVGGAFGRIDARFRYRLAAVTADPAMPAVTTASVWNPRAGGTVRALALAGTTLYAGGDFGSVGGERRSRIAALSLNDGRATAWDPAADGVVRVLSFSPGGTSLYVGGEFTAIGGLVRNRVAELDRRTGLARFWNPSADGPVYAIEPAPDLGVIYVGGAFGIIGGQQRPLLAELRGNGTATPWTADLSGSSASPATAGAVHALLVSGETLYVGGDFARAGNADRKGLVALEAATGAPLSWAPQVAGVVRTLALHPDRNALYIGGEFVAVNSDDRGNMAAVDLDSGLATAWHPDADGPVRGLALSRDLTSVYAGGRFSRAGGVTAAGLAALDSIAGTALGGWPHEADSGVHVLQVAADGRTIYIGGAFTRLDDAARAHLAALDALALETMPPVTTPDPPAGAYNGENFDTVALNCDDGQGAGCAATYYTLDGSPPTPRSLVYDGPIELRDDTTLRYFSIDRLGNAETPGSARYVLDLQPPRTTVSPPSRVFSERRIRVTLTCSDSKSGCAGTFYSKNENDPPEAFLSYGAPITIADNTVLRFYSVDQAGNREVVRRADYVSNYGGPGTVHPLLLGGLVLLGLARRRRR